MKGVIIKMINNKLKHSCVVCGKEYPNTFDIFCDNCNGFIDIDYDMNKVTIKQDNNPLLKYFDLLPVLQQDNLTWIGCGNTPCIHAKTLGKLLGSDNLYLKDETKNPTWTTKDRMASVVLSYFKEHGIKTFATSSTGNSSTSLATAVNMFPFLKLYIFTGVEFADRLNFEISPNLKIISLEGATFVEASQEAAKFAKANGIVSEAGFFNPARREGLKLAFMEACDQMGKSPDWYFQAVSSAMGVYGTYKAAGQYHQLGRIDKIPKFCCVQQDLCSPMVKAWEEKSSIIEKHHIFEKPSGLAKAILRGNPQRSYPYIYNIVKETGGEFVMVTQKEIIEAQELVLKTEKIDICPTSACTIAALKKMLGNGVVKREEVVLVNLTGRERADTSFPKGKSDIKPIKESMWRRENFWLDYQVE
jgi:threonine synthase